MTQQGVLRRDDISEFISKRYEGDLHAKRVLSLSNATLGVLTSAALAIHAVGQGLAQAMGKLSKHGVKQSDRLLSNEGIDVERFFGYWVAYMVGARPEIVVAAGLDELRARRPRDARTVDADRARAGDAADVEDGAGVDVEGQSEAR